MTQRVRMGERRKRQAWRHVPFCSRCGDLVEGKRHPSDTGDGPYCPGCGRLYPCAPPCHVGRMVASLKGAAS